MQQVALEKAGFATPITPISSQGMERFAVSIEDIFEAILNGEQDFDRMLFSASTELAITSGALATPTLALHSVKAETGTTDDLTNIPAVNESFLLLKAKTGHSIAILSGVSNINVPGTVNLSLSGNRVVLLYCQGGQWSVIGWSLPLDNTSATSDPTSSDDASAGYSTDSLWMNTTLDRAWVCVDATTGAALWRLITPYTNSFSWRSGDNSGTATQNIGVAALTTNGSSGGQTDSVDVFHGFTTAASAGASAGFVSASFNLLRLDHNVIAEFNIKTVTNATNMRMWVGLTTAGITDVDTIAAGTKFVGFRFSTVGSIDSGWKPILNNGTTQSEGTAIGTVAGATAYKLRIRVDSANNRAYFSVNDSVEQLLSSNFPAATTEMGIVARVYSQAAEIKAIYMAMFEVGW